MADYTEQEGQQAFEQYKEIQANEAIRRQLYAENIEILGKMRESGSYKVIQGDETTTWAGFLGLVDIMYSRNEVHNMLRVKYKFIDQLHLTYEEILDIPISRLIHLIPVVTQENVQTLVDQAKVLTNQDFQDEIRKLKGLPTTDDEHEHKFTQYAICSVCGLKHKQDENRNI